VWLSADLAWILLDLGRWAQASAWERAMRFVLRVAILVAGVGLCAIGLSAAGKLFRETLDSPRWMVGGAALVTCLGGATVIVAAIIDFRRQRGPNPPHVGS
jgi:hypothetical protein